MEIDSFFCTIRDLDTEYYNRWVHFYRKSGKMSKAYYEKYPRGVHMHLVTHDKIVVYEMKNRYKDGNNQKICKKEVYSKRRQYSVNTEACECK